MWMVIPAKAGNQIGNGSDSKPIIVAPMDQADKGRRWNRAKERRKSAQMCFDQECYSDSITLSYYACYQAMWVAVDDPPAGLWRHGGLINEFCQGQWQHPSVAPQRMASLRQKLDQLYLHRIQVDYEAQSLGQNAAQEGLNTMDEILRLVAQQTGLSL